MESQQPIIGPHQFSSRPAVVTIVQFQHTCGKAGNSSGGGSTTLRVGEEWVTGSPILRSVALGGAAVPKWQPLLSQAAGRPSQGKGTFASPQALLTKRQQWGNWGKLNWVNRRGRLPTLGSDLLQLRHSGSNWK